MIENRGLEIINYLKQHPNSSSKELFDNTKIGLSYATVKRMLSKLVDENLLAKDGKGKGTKYFISPAYELLQPVDLDKYYLQEIDDRKIKDGFNFELISGILKDHTLFTESEVLKLQKLEKSYLTNISQLSENEYKKELERLAIDLSWKSSQIEGNTYSLLETERLLKEKETASGKTKDEATMLLNHKEAIDFIVANPDYLIPLTVSKIEDIHSILVNELIIEKNLRKRRIGISGTNYKPLDNEFQIKEALSNMCILINSKQSIFEKALLALLLISYIRHLLTEIKELPVL